MSFDAYKMITLDDMIDFIEKNDPSWGPKFAEIAYQNKDGQAVAKYNHLNAKKKFCEKYMPELIPVAQEKPIPAYEKLKKWAPKK